MKLKKIRMTHRARNQLKELGKFFLAFTKAIAIVAIGIVALVAVVVVALSMFYLMWGTLEDIAKLGELIYLGGAAWIALATLGAWLVFYWVKESFYVDTPVNPWESAREDRV